MKKIFAGLLVAVLALSMTVAMAAGTDTTGWKSAEASYDTLLTKDYTSSTSAFPHETLSFTVEPDAGNPDGGTAMITVDDLTVTALTGNKITINLPEYTVPGVYKYTITEDEGDTQGVTYSTEEIAIDVLVSYDYDNSCLVAQVGVDKPDKDTEKNDTIENEYKLGGNKDGGESLKVSKSVTGNLADQGKYFHMTVTLTAEEYVRSDIEVSGGSHEDNPTLVAWDPEDDGEGWIGENVIDIYLKDGETITFNKIPEGVTYVVEEDSTHLAAGVTPTQAELNGTEGYLATYTDKEGTIAKDSEPEAKVLNTKENEINTGVSLSSLPYVLIVALVIAGSVIMMIRRRRAAED